LEAHIRATYDVLLRAGSLPAQAEVRETAPLRRALGHDGTVT
jgi:hypothetical protein